MAGLMIKDLGRITKMIKQIDDPNTKQIIARSVLESLRDWFEVERILLPSMGVPADKMISNSSINLLENFSDIKENDIIEMFELVEVKR